MTFRTRWLIDHTERLAVSSSFSLLSTDTFLQYSEKSTKSAKQFNLEKIAALSQNQESREMGKGEGNILSTHAWKNRGVFESLFFSSFANSLFLSLVCALYVLFRQAVVSLDIFGIWDVDVGFFFFILTREYRLCVQFRTVKLGWNYKVGHSHSFRGSLAILGIFFCCRDKCNWTHERASLAFFSSFAPIIPKSAYEFMFFFWYFRDRSLLNFIVRNQQHWGESFFFTSAIL